MNATRACFSVLDYDLESTFDCGQAFRWRFIDGGWEGIIGSRWVRLMQQQDCIVAQTAEPVSNWKWLADYLQIAIDLRTILKAFPNDAPMKTAVNACHGLRLLRQDRWECLASFICSSTKQIVQIRQIIDLLCRRFGEPLPVPPGHEPVFSFPMAMRIANASESELRECKMGFRAPYLLGCAQMVAAGQIDLAGLSALSLTEARAALMTVPGVGRKIADCTLLFSCGFERAFPMDVWILKTLRTLYFPRRRPKPRDLIRFSETYFGEHAGYAQQYLFHHARNL